MITEDQLEQLCLDWFTDQGYLFKNGYDIAPDGDSPERDDYHQVVLKQRLLERLEVLNPELPQESLDVVVNTVSTPDTPVLIKSNRAFHKYLIEGVPVEYTVYEDGETKTKHTHARLMDFTNPDNNEFLVVNQFTITGKKGNRRPDVVVFINGLPIAVIELKNPADEHADIWHAYNQLQTYKDEIPDLFVFNESLVVSDGWTARVGSLTANKERFYHGKLFLVKTINRSGIISLKPWLRVSSSLIYCLITFVTLSCLKLTTTLSSRKLLVTTSSMPCERQSKPQCERNRPMANCL